MANEYYLSSGLVPIDTGETATSNTAYFSAGLVPTDSEGGEGEGEVPAQAQVMTPFVIVMI